MLGGGEMQMHLQKIVARMQLKLSEVIAALLRALQPPPEPPMKRRPF